MRNKTKKKSGLVKLPIDETNRGHLEQTTSFSDRKSNKIRRTGQTEIDERRGRDRDQSGNQMAAVERSLRARDRLQGRLKQAWAGKGCNRNGGRCVHFSRRRRRVGRKSSMEVCSFSALSFIFVRFLEIRRSMVNSTALGT